MSQQIDRLQALLQRIQKNAAQLATSRAESNHLNEGTSAAAAAGSAASFGEPEETTPAHAEREPVIAAEPAQVTSEPPFASEPPQIPSKPPPFAEQPRALSEPPQVASEPPQVLSEPPQVASEPPQALSEPPQVASEPPRALPETLAEAVERAAQSAAASRSQASDLERESRPRVRTDATWSEPPPESPVAQHRHDTELTPPLDEPLGEESLAESLDDGPRTPPPESGPQVSFPPKPPGADLDAEESLPEPGAAADASVTEPEAEPEEAPTVAGEEAAAGAGFSLEDYEEPLPAASTGGVYDESLAAPPTAEEDLAAHDRAEAERETRLSEPPAAAAGMRPHGVVTRTPVPERTAAAVFEGSRARQDGTFLDLLDDALRL